VKIRGHRIELGELEGAVKESNAVREVVALVREDVPGDKRLVLYVVPASSDSFDLGALNDDLRSRLPAFMLPSAIVVLASLPLNANGKFDRRMLPAPDYRASAEVVEPRNDLERAVARIWSELLGVPRVGIRDNFFALGGHSLIAIRVASRLRDDFGWEITVRKFLENPTVEKLCEAFGTGEDDDVERF
jgi:acyl carrier protein